MCTGICLCARHGTGLWADSGVPYIFRPLQDGALQSKGEPDGSLVIIQLDNYNFGESYKGKVQGSEHMTKVPHLFEGIRYTPEPTTITGFVKAKEIAQAKAMIQEGPDKGQKNVILEPETGSKWWRAWA